MDYYKITMEEKNQIKAEIGLDQTGMEEAVKLLREWLNMQPHLPHNCEDARLERWITICKNSLERVKSSIDLYYTLKNVMPDLMTDRDPRSKWFQDGIAIGHCIPLPQLTDEYYRVTVIGLTDGDPNKFNMLEIFKAFLLYADLGLCEEYNSGVIFVVDMENYSVAHATKVTLPLVRKFHICLYKALNLRVKAVHFVNAPSFADGVINLFKSVLKPKLATRVHSYPKGSLKLTEKISPKILPVDYGGENKTIQELKTAWLKHVYSYRDWFLEQDKYKADESKRPGKAFDSGELFGFEGTFRQLSVD